MGHVVGWSSTLTWKKYGGPRLFYFQPPGIYLEMLKCPFYVQYSYPTL